MTPRGLEHNYTSISSHWALTRFVLTIQFRFELLVAWYSWIPVALSMNSAVDIATRCQLDMSNMQPSLLLHIIEYMYRMYVNLITRHFGVSRVSIPRSISTNFCFAVLFDCIDYCCLADDKVPLFYLPCLLPYNREARIEPECAQHFHFAHRQTLPAEIYRIWYYRSMSRTRRWGESVSVGYPASAIAIDSRRSNKQSPDGQ